MFIVPGRLEEERKRIAFELTEPKINRFLKKSFSRFYDFTYPVYIEEFAKLNGDASIRSWAKRVGMVYSWIPGISNSAFRFHDDLDQVAEDAEAMTKLAERFKGKKLEDSQITIGDSKGDFQLTLDDGQKVDLKNEVQPVVGRLMHGKVSEHTQIATNSKMLHFIAPELFPIMDKNICERVFHKGNPRLYDYMDYMALVKSFLEDETLSSLHNNMPVSKLYIIDGVLFN